MYEDGQLETELKVLKSVVKKLGNVNGELSKIKINRVPLVSLIADLHKELDRRKQWMQQYRETGEF